MTTLNVTDLDFGGIRQNLKVWMAANPDFTDYDFEASGLSFLLDTLAYNTHYNAVLANFMANEMFLDSALKRSSVLSHAKALGYRPRSVFAARARIDLTVNAVVGGTPPAQFILRRGTGFTTTIGNQYYQFVTTKDHVASLSGGAYYFTDIDLVEGIFNTYVYKLTNDVTTKYLIPNVRTDASTVKMYIYTDTNSSDFVEWERAANAINVFDTSRVFFTQETDKQYTEFYFGNGVVGARPAANSIVKIEYVSCNGVEGNGAKLFTPAGNLTHDNGSVVASSFTITLVQESYGGANSESVNEIKYHASNHFSTQNRAVTANDYVSLIRAGFTNLEDIKVWGGEESAQKQFGSVFICIKPNTGSYLTQAEKTDIRTLMQNKTLMGTKLVFVDPDYVNVIVDSRVKYDIDKRDTGIDLGAIVKDEILRFSDDSLESFNNSFKFSNLISTIDAANKAVVNNQTTIRLQKAQTPILGISRNYTFNFFNPIKNDNGVITSSAFLSPDYADNVIVMNKGTSMVMGYYNQFGKFITIREVGTVDFKLGTISLNGVNVLMYEGTEFYVQAIPASTDIYAKENNVLRIRPQDVTVSLELVSA